MKEKFGSFGQPTGNPKRIVIERGYPQTTIVLRLPATRRFEDPNGMQGTLGGGTSREAHARARRKARRQRHQQ